jgi:transcriptional regulator with XRE-family HTH domain
VNGSTPDGDGPSPLGGPATAALTSAGGGSPVKREIEHRWRELGEYVREQRRVGQLSLRRLSELSGISNPYLSQIERGLRRPSAGILQQLARALHISAETLYVRAGMLDDERGGPAADLIEAIRRTTDLDDEHKRTLIHIYESFRAERTTRLERAAKAERPSRLERSRARARRVPDADGTVVPGAPVGVPTLGEEGESPPAVGG